MPARTLPLQYFGLSQKSKAGAAGINPPPQPVGSDHALTFPCELPMPNVRPGLLEEEIRRGLLSPHFSSLQDPGNMSVDCSPPSPEGAVRAGMLLTVSHARD